MKSAVALVLTCIGVSLTLLGDVFIKRSGIWTHPSFLIIGAVFYVGGCIPVAFLFRALEFGWVFILWESISVILAVAVGQFMFGENPSFTKMLAVALALCAVVLSWK